MDWTRHASWIVEEKSMHSSSGKRVCLTCAVLISFLGAVLAGSGNSGPQSGSRITGVAVSGSQSAGTFGGVPYTRTWGAVTGVVSPGENLHGFAALPHD